MAAWWAWTWDGAGVNFTGAWISLVTLTLGTDSTTLATGLGAGINLASTCCFVIRVVFAFGASLTGSMCLFLVSWVDSTTAFFLISFFSSFFYALKSLFLGNSFTGDTYLGTTFLAVLVSTTLGVSSTLAIGFLLGDRTLTGATSFFTIANFVGSAIGVTFLVGEAGFFVTGFFSTTTFLISYLTGEWGTIGSCLTGKACFTISISLLGDSAFLGATTFFTGA